MRRVIYGMLVAFGIFMLIAPISVPLFMTNAEFSILNSGWNGCSSFGKLLYNSSKLTPILSPLDSFHLEDGALIIVGPDLGYSQEEISEIRTFLERGGTLVLIDDFGTGNEILEGLNLTVRFAKEPFLDIFYYKNENFPQLVKILDPALGKGVSRIVLNLPSSLLNTNGEIYTSKVTILGKNQREYPIMAELRYGGGRIILFSDPSVFINDMYKINERFIQNFVRYINTDKIYIDEAHHSNFNIYQQGYVRIRRAVDREKIFYVFVIVSAVAIIVESGLALNITEKLLGLILKSMSKEEKKSTEDIVKALSREGYNEKILLKMIREIETGKKLGGKNERKGLP